MSRIRTVLAVFALSGAFASAVHAEGWGPLNAARQTEIAASLPATPSGFGQPIAVRKVWDSLKTVSGYSGLVGAATPYLTASYPAWSDSLYLDYSKTGNRGPGEVMMWNRLKWLTPLVWAECLENKKRFLPVIEKVLGELVNQPTWVLPAHDGGLTTFKRQSYFVDLNAANVAHQLAQTLWLLKGSLSTATYDKVYAALNTRVFASVKASYSTYAGNDWLMRTNNWNSVCLAGVTGAALTVIPDRNERALFAVAAEKYSKNYLQGYLADGYGLEGLGYYNYGFTDYMTLREILWQKTSGKLDLFTDPKVKNIAQYGPRLMVQNNVWPTIADCRVKTVAADNIMWYCGRVFGLKLGAKYEVMPAFVATSNITFGTMHAFPNSASLAPSPATGTSVGLRTEFADADVFILRPKSTVGTVGVAINGGNNGDSHNHNDLGSFSVVSGNEELVGDPGGPTFYNSDVFSGVRYTKYKQFSSWGHPLPVVAGKTQLAGAAAVAKVLSTSYSDAQDVVTMDLRAAYGVASATVLQRSFAYSRAGTGLLTVTDSVVYTGANSFETAITTHAGYTRPRPELLKFKGASNVLYARIDAGNRAFTLTSEAVSELGLSFTRIGIKLVDPLVAGAVRITYANDSASLYPAAAKVLAAAAIVAQPTSMWGNVGGTASFRATASGDSLSYQWMRNGTAIAGATGASYSFSGLTLADSGARFSVKVSNRTSSVTSYAALLAVHPVTLSIATTGNWFGGITVNYSLPASIPSATLQILSASGTEVKSLTVLSTSNRARFTSLSGKAAGLYTVRLVWNGKLLASRTLLKI